MSNSATAAAGRVAFRYASFRRLVTARFLATVSSEMQAVGVAWQVYGLTGRPLDLGLVGLAQFLPGIFLFLLVGHVVDRFPRRRILIFSSAAFALCSLALMGLTLGGLRAVWPIYAVLLLNGAVRAFHTPAHQALVPQIVPEEHFPNAVSWGSSIFQAAMVLGPMIGGLLYGFGRQPHSGLCVRGRGVRGVAGAAHDGARGGAAARAEGGIAGRGTRGLRYIRRNRLLLGAITPGPVRGAAGRGGGAAAGVRQRYSARSGRAGWACCARRRPSGRWRRRS